MDTNSTNPVPAGEMSEMSQTPDHSPLASQNKPGRKPIPEALLEKRRKKAAELRILGVSYDSISNEINKLDP